MALIEFTGGMGNNVADMKRWLTPKAAALETGYSAETLRQYGREKIIRRRVLEEYGRVELYMPDVMRLIKERQTKGTKRGRPAKLLDNSSMAL